MSNQNRITSLPSLTDENYEQIFNVYQDSDGRYFYNLLQTVAIPTDLPPGYYTKYNVVYGDTWPYISYKNYNTPNLWWVITSSNNIIDPTSIPSPGTAILVLKPKIVSKILNQVASSVNQ
jgi:nucleoid-associated protein YgaU